LAACSSDLRPRQKQTGITNVQKAFSNKLRQADTEVHHLEEQFDSAADDAEPSIAAAVAHA
jgi:hypothetical protein